MDAWNPDQLKRMQMGGNAKLNAFLKEYGIPKHTDIKEKYNSKPAEFYREKIRAEVDGRPYKPPLPSEVHVPLPRPKSFAAIGHAGDWDDGSWDEHEPASGTRPLHAASESRLSNSSGQYTMAQLHTSAANKEDFFSRKMAENASRPEGLPPSQGGKYVGFGSTPTRPPSQKPQHGIDDMTEMFQKGLTGIGTFAGQAAIAARERAEHFNNSLKESGVHDQISQSASIAAEKTKQYGTKGWSLLKNAYAVAASKIEKTAAEQGLNVDLGSRKIQTEAQHRGGGRGGYERVGTSSGPVSYVEDEDAPGGGWKSSAHLQQSNGFSGSDHRNSGLHTGPDKYYSNLAHNTNGIAPGFNNDEDDWGEGWETGDRLKISNNGGHYDDGARHGRKEQNGNAGNEWTGWEDAGSPSPGQDDWGKW